MKITLAMALVILSFSAMAGNPIKDALKPLTTIPEDKVAPSNGLGNPTTGPTNPGPAGKIGGKGLPPWIVPTLPNKN